MSKITLKIDYNKYRTYNELYETMKKLADAYPSISKLYSIGKTLQGRELWTMEITNHDTGPPEEKPGLWIDGNTHSLEITGSAVCLRTIGYLLEKYGIDPFVTNILDTKSIYILPRLNPDGAEIFLTQPYYNTAAGIPNPDFVDGEGHYEEDVDGNGTIVYMRIKDPNGGWKVSRKDPRLMLRRDLKDTEKDGPFYRVITEGMFLKYKPGNETKVAPPRFIGGTNRNYPAHWAPGGLPLGGAGPFPLWEREARALADFWADHPNLSGIHTFHTAGGVILRESVTKPDSFFADEGLEADLVAYKAIAKIGEEITGYPALSSFEDFNFEFDRPFRRGCGGSFFYEYLGALIFSVELWDWPYLVGVGNFRERGGIEFSWEGLDEDKQLKALDWIDKEMKGEAFVNWKLFNHPQLGPVEIGGMCAKYTICNPPEGKWLNYEIEKTMMFALNHAALLPLLRITHTKIIQVSKDVFKIEVQLENTSFLPTNVTQMAIKVKIAKPVIAELVIEDGAELVSGSARVELGHLSGRLAKLLLPANMDRDVKDESKRSVEWIVKINNPKTKVTIVARCPRAGVDRKQVILG